MSRDVSHWTVASIGIDGDVQQKNNKFPQPLFGCFQTTDCGLNCCCAHVFCSPCIWASAMQLAPLSDESMARVEEVTDRRILSQVLQSQDSDGVVALGRGIGAATAFKSARVRRKLLKNMFGGYESYGRSVCIHVCCPLCATIQEVDGVLVWRRMKDRPEVFYGPVGGCNCCSLVDGNGKEVEPDISLTGGVEMMMMRR